MSFQVNKRPIVWAILSGIMLILSFPPFPFPFFAYFAFVPLLMLIEQRKRVFPYIYLAFFIWNWGCGYWLGLTMFGVEKGEKFMAFMTGFLANSLNPLLMYLPIWAYKSIRLRWSSPWNLSAFVAFWILFEFLHLRWDLSWSWHTLGHALSYVPIYIQYLEVTGVLGASLHILLANVCIYLALKQWDASQWSEAKKALSVWVGWMILPLLLSVYFLNPNRSMYQPSGTLNVRIIQPNIDPFYKFGVISPNEQLRLFADLINQKGVDTIQMALLPETAIPQYVWRHKLKEDALIQPLWQIVESKKLNIVSGIIEARHFDATYTPLPASARKYQDGFYEMYNATAVLSPDSVTETFQKGKMVPFVERTPFMELLPFMKSMGIEIGGGYGGYGLPEDFRPLHLKDKTAFAPMVCYESEYGDYVRKFTKLGAQFMIITTNDGWWLKSSGHIQHAQFATLRAIENRRDIARSANTGISLFADSKGYLHQKTAFWEKAYIDRKMNLYKGITFYVRFGDWMGYLALLISLGFVLLRFTRKAQT